MLFRMPNTPDQIRNLLHQFKALESAGAGSSSHADHDKRNQLLDELQDAVGLGGKMVMERDIVKKAELLVQQD
jgi:hypothetical protein